MRLTALDHLHRFDPGARSVYSYDLRAVHTVRWCTDTWDGSTTPLNGIVWDSVYCEHEFVGSNGRVFHNGSRETQAKHGWAHLATALEDLADLHKKLTGAIRRVVHGKTTEATVESPLKPEHTALYVTHPSYRELSDAATQPKSPVELSFDQQSETWTIRQRRRADY